MIAEYLDTIHYRGIKHNSLNFENLTKWHSGLTMDISLGFNESFFSLKTIFILPVLIAVKVNSSC